MSPGAGPDPRPAVTLCRTGTAESPPASSTGDGCGPAPAFLEGRPLFRRVREASDRTAPWKILDCPRTLARPSCLKAAAESRRPKFLVSAYQYRSSIPTPICSVYYRSVKSLAADAE